MGSPSRYELTDIEWSIIEPLLPNKPREVLPACYAVDSVLQYVQHYSTAF
ncbi:hypothetical protein [Bradyrhizobium sp. RT5a]